MRHGTLAGLVALGLVAGLAAATAQDSPGGLEATVQPIFDRECVKCHGAKEKKSKLDLSAGEAYKSLVSVPSREVPETMRVKPGDPEQSYLWLKVNHTASEGSGMPKGIFFSKKLSAQDLEAIRSWIASGARP